MRTLATYAFVITIAVSCAGGSRQQEPISVVDDVPLYELGTERLPDLNQARGTHAITVINGELTVIGGHTDGFIPSTTAEYFGGGRWHLINSVYAHDGGFLVRIPDGRFVIGGGSAESFGVGRTFWTESAPSPLRHCFPEERSSCLATGTMTTPLRSWRLKWV